jgi:predicted nucleotidyltransferase
MSNLIEHLVAQKLIKPPPWLATNLHYLTVMGSVAYGVADTNDETSPSDYDLYGVCVPPREVVFPHLAGEIWGFGKYKDGMPKNHFGQYQKAHVLDPSARGGKGREYDLQIYNIVKYVQLCSECNPNMIDSLFTHETCVLHCTQVGNLLRDHRKQFLHQGVCDKFKGYAYSQVLTSNPRPPGGNPPPGTRTGCAAGPGTVARRARSAG